MIMYLFSHVKVGHIFWKTIKQHETDFPLDFISFMYGNIKPDVTKLCMMKHQLADTIEIYNTYKKQSMDRTLSAKQRSEALGVACHYICDYFTKYHGREPYNNKNLFSHFFYEIKLHINILTHLLFCGGIQGNLIHEFSPIKQFTSIRPRALMERFDSDMSGLIEAYYNHDETVITDVRFILTGVNQLLMNVLVSEVKPESIKAEECMDMLSDHIA